MPQSINISGKVYGLNLVMQYPTATSANWYVIWENFPTHWPAYIKREVDVALAMGCNTVRMFGDFRWYRDGNITQTQYHSYWNTFLDYCATVGMKVYPCASGANEAVSATTANLNNSQVITLVNAWLAAIADYDSIIIAVDVLQEVPSANWQTGTSAAQIAAACNTIYDGVKAGGTTHPLTFSVNEQIGASSPVADAMVGQACVDFIDYHNYNTPTSSAMTTALSHFAGYDIIIGEFGISMNGTTSTQRRQFIADGTDKQVNYPDARARGGLVWAATKQSSSGDWGVTSSTWVERPELIQPFTGGTALAVGNGPFAPAAPIVPHDNVVLVSPRAVSRDYATTKIYRNGSTLLANNALGYYDDSAYAGKQRYYTAIGSTNTHGDSSASSAYVYPGRLPRKLLRRRVAATFR